MAILLLLIIAFNLLESKFAYECITHSPSSDYEWHNEKVASTCEGDYCVFENQANVVRRGCSSMNLNENTKDCETLPSGTRRCYCTGDRCNKKYFASTEDDKKSLVKPSVLCYACCPYLGGKCDEIKPGKFCSSHELDTRICLQAHNENRTFAAEMSTSLYGQARMCSNPDIFRGTTSCYCNYNHCNVISHEANVPKKSTNVPTITCCSAGSVISKKQVVKSTLGCTNKCLGNYCGMEYYEIDGSLQFNQFCLNSTDLINMFDLKTQFGQVYQRAFICKSNLCNEGGFHYQIVGKLTSSTVSIKIVKGNRLIGILFLFWFLRCF